MSSVINTLESLKSGVDECIECETCMEEGICPTYFVKRDKTYSPLGRIFSLRKLVSQKKPQADELETIKESLLTCTGCGRCTEVCPVDVKVGELSTLGRNVLYGWGIIPTEKQRKIADGIFSLGNAVGRKEEDRVIYKREIIRDFIGRKSETLLFLGCISSFFHENAVAASVNILKDLGIDFTLLENEGCCGIFLYDGGYFDRAEELFRKNVERFSSAGIKRIIVLCASCHKCFKMYYPNILGEIPFDVVHFVEVVEEELSKGKTLPANSEEEFTLHDPCKLSRFMGIVDTQRAVLRKLGVNYTELSEKGRMSLCCGAGSGVRAYSPELAMDIAERVIRESGKRRLITLCPFCSFNFNYTSRKRSLESKAIYISEALWSKDT